MIRLQDGVPNTCVKVDTEGSLLVKGIEDWIQGLTPINGIPCNFKDSDTGARFEIRRVE
jgi:hypothetical protein